jgi:hypothetical protein
MNIDLREIPTKYINLNRHPERNEKMGQLIEAVKFNDIERVQGVDMPNDSMAGCASSHLQIFSSMSGPTTILEDDCELRNKNYLIDIPDNTDALYLGLSSWALNVESGMQWIHSFVPVDGYPHLTKINNMLATHAILYISDEYKEMCIRAAKYSARNSVHVDVSFARFQRFYNVYALNDPIFYQSSNTKATDITFDQIKNRKHK